ncbi:MAG: tRNA (guanosine(37)-N1)-methyltransferase TrmD [Treponema sp.]|nr:tRNA (guanosine(37)-N1)-methyltransferase TrmD [Treponema sp.]
MKFSVLTLFPEITDAYFASSIMAKALDKGIIRYRAVNIRDFALDKHKTCDDAPYGGGPGMLMLAEPLSRALESVGVDMSQKFSRRDAEDAEKNLKFDINERASASSAPWREENKDDAIPHVIYLSPSGRPFTQKRAEELAAMEELVLVCGRYEGIDQRIIDTYVDEELSVGDYVLSSGETAALVVIDAVYRLVDKVITAQSLEEESFGGGLLEYPQYTRPEIFDTIKVPEILLSGHHENIRKWRLKKRVEKTLAVRPELVEQGLWEGLFDAETVKLIEEGKKNDERD